MLELGVDVGACGVFTAVPGADRCDVVVELLSLVDRL